MVSASPVKEKSPPEPSAGGTVPQVEEHPLSPPNNAVTNPELVANTTPSKSAAPFNEMNIPPDLVKPLEEVLPPSTLAPAQIQGKSSDLISPTVKQKVDQFEGTSTPTIRIDKRKPEGSPENTEMSRKELKSLRVEVRKQDKQKRKQEHKQKNTLQINNSY